MFLDPKARNTTSKRSKHKRSKYSSKLPNSSYIYSVDTFNHFSVMKGLTRWNTERRTQKPHQEHSKGQNRKVQSNKVEISTLKKPPCKTSR